VFFSGSIGCRSASDETPSVTEMKRRRAGADVARVLLDGQRAYERGSYAVALAMTDSVEQRAPDLADLHFLRGGVYTQLNQLGVAQAAYHRVLELDAEYKGARYNLGLLEFRRGNLRDAIDWLQKERELEETSSLALELGRIYAKLGEPDSARMAYERSIVLDSTNSTAYMWLGQLYEELGQMDDALEASRQGLRLRPEDADYQYVVGSLLFRMGRIDEAEPYLENVSAKRRWHHGAQFNMGQLLMRKGREDEAKAYFARADSAQQMQQKITEAEEMPTRSTRRSKPSRSPSRSTRGTCTSRATWLF
jgi:tetratricopeptide (TPR) repeat protein